jgi:hypothetical protein
MDLHAVEREMTTDIEMAAETMVCRICSKTKLCKHRQFPVQIHSEESSARARNSSSIWTYETHRFISRASIKQIYSF